MHSHRPLARALLVATFAVLALLALLHGMGILERVIRSGPEVAVYRRGAALADALLRGAWLMGGAGFAALALALVGRRAWWVLCLAALAASCGHAVILARAGAALLTPTPEALADVVRLDAAAGMAWGALLLAGAASVLHARTAARGVRAMRVGCGAVAVLGLTLELTREAATFAATQSLWGDAFLGTPRDWIALLRPGLYAVAAAATLVALGVTDREAETRGG